MTILRFLWVVSLLCCASLGHCEEKELRGGWYVWDPYQYTSSSELGNLSLTGLDIQLTKEIATISRLHLNNVQYVKWKDHLDGLKNGTLDFACGATYTKERAEFLHYSIPYRFEENSLFVKRGAESSWPMQNVDEMLAFLVMKQKRISVVGGFVFADPKINVWINDPKNQHLILRTKDENENLDNLLRGKSDCFLGDRISAATVIWRAHEGTQVSEINLHIKTPIHFIFSKKTVSLAVLDIINNAIQEMKNKKEYDTVIQNYFHPIILLQTIDSWWFHFVDYLGTFAFAISGLIIAYRDRATLFGAFIFAVLPSIGGGIVRDVIFQRSPVGALQSPVYLSIILCTVLAGFVCLKVYALFQHKLHFHEHVVHRQKKILQHILTVCDGLGLAAFTVIGIIVCVVVKVQPLWLWGPFFAFLTGAGGGIMRDLLSKDRHIAALDGRTIYPEISVIWGLMLSFFLIFQAHKMSKEPIQYAVMITVVGVFVTRMIIYIFDIPNLIFRGKNSFHNESA